MEDIPLRAFPSRVTKVEVYDEYKYQWKGIMEGYMGKVNLTAINTSHISYRIF